MLIRKFVWVIGVFLLLIITSLIPAFQLKAQSIIPGDANGDGKVDGSDFTVWQNHFDQSVTGVANGDFNLDHYVNGIDYVIWLNNITEPVIPDIVVAAAGDIIDTCTGTACEYYKVSDAILSINPNLVLALGDLSNNSGVMADYTGPFQNSWGRFKSIISPVPGNHDYGTSGAANYYNYFGTNVTHGPNGYYSFDLGNWHFVAINSNCDKLTGGCANGSPEETWLKGDLAANTKPCTLAFWHHPRYSSGHDGDNLFMADIYQDLYNANTEIVLSGHSHDYERFAPQNNLGQLDTTKGITQFVVGTGGAFWTGYNAIEPNSRAHQNTIHGALQLALHSDSYDWSFIPEAGKTWTDSGSTLCH
jgi:acid phosphatase type 7